MYPTFAYGLQQGLPTPLHARGFSMVLGAWQIQVLCFFWNSGNIFIFLSCGCLNLQMQNLQVWTANSNLNGSAYFHFIDDEMEAPEVQ